MIKEKLIIICSRFPYPLEKGDKLRLFHQIRFLSIKYDIELISIHEKSIKSKDFQAVNKYCAQIHLFKINKVGIYWSIIKAFFLSKMPLQVAYFYKKKWNNQIQKIINQSDAKNIYCQLIRVAPYCINNDKFKVLDYMDAFSLGMKRRFETSSFPKKFIYKIEYNRTREFEKKMLNAFDDYTIISKSDRSFINNSSINIIKNGIDNQFFSPNANDKEYDIVFVGNMQYAPNVDAAFRLINEIFPIIQSQKADCKILIAGANPVNALLKLENENIKFSSWVEDIRDAYTSAKVFMAPLEMGRGLQNKVLEAMSMKIPCIISDTANDGIKAVHKQDVFIANNLEDYAKYFFEILEKSEKSESEINNILDNARNFVIQNFDWSTETQKLINIFK